MRIYWDESEPSDALGNPFEGDHEDTADLDLTDLGSPAEWSHWSLAQYGLESTENPRP